MDRLLPHRAKQARCSSFGDAAILVKADAAVISEEDPDRLFVVHFGENVDGVFFIISLLPERKKSLEGSPGPRFEHSLASLNERIARLGEACGFGYRGLRQFLFKPEAFQYVARTQSYRMITL